MKRIQFKLKGKEERFVGNIARVLQMDLNKLARRCIIEGCIGIYNELERKRKMKALETQMQEKRKEANEAKTTIPTSPTAGEGSTSEKGTEEVGSVESGE